jgi:hypothetical protein
MGSKLISYNTQRLYIKRIEAKILFGKKTVRYLIINSLIEELKDVLQEIQALLA